MNRNPNCNCLGVVPGANAVTRPGFALLRLVPEGASKFWTLKILKASKRSCRFHPSFGSGKLLNIDVSRLNTAGPRKVPRPRLPKPLGTPSSPGIVNAQALNQLT